MELPPPAVILPVHRPDMLHPALHAVKLSGQDGFVPVKLVQRPGDDAGGVPPGGGAVPLAEGGNHVGHGPAVGPLFQGQVVEVLGVKGIAVPLIAGGGGEHLGVPRPAHALVPLGAVSGHVDEIPLLPPLNVGDEPVHQPVPGIQPPRPGHLGVQRQGGEVLRLQVRQALHLHIAVAVIGEFRLQHVWQAVGHVDVFRLGGAQVVPVEVPVLQDLSELETDCLAPGRTAPQTEAPRQILPQIQHRLPRRGVDDLLYRQLLPHRHRGAVPRCQLPRRRLYQPCPLRGQWRQGVVPVFAVIEVGKGDIRAGDSPILIGADHLLCSISIGQLHLGNQFPASPVVRFLLTVRPKAPLVPAIAQDNGQDARRL